MSIHITILGLNRIGASIGLCLQRYSDQFEITGFDPTQVTATEAKKINAVDHIEFNLLKSAKTADVIVLSLPTNKIRETLTTIAPSIGSGVVILDTSIAKQSVAKWVEDLIPDRSHYVGITPLLDTQFFNDRDGTILSATPDLFNNSLMAIGAPFGTDSAAITLAADLSGLLGAKAFFCDMAELDGFTASARLLPQLVSASVVNATLNQPGWADAGKFTEAEYAVTCSGIAGNEEIPSLSEAVILNKETVLRGLDSFLATIDALRDDIEHERSSELELKLESARKGRLKWWQERQKAGTQGRQDKSLEMPKSGDFWKQQIGFLSRSRVPGPPSKNPEKKE